MPLIPKNNNTASSTFLFSLPTLFLFFNLLCILSLAFFFFTATSHHSHFPLSSSLHKTLQSSADFINVCVADLRRNLNYGLLDRYWSFDSDFRPGSDSDRQIRSTNLAKNREFPPYPENPLIKQYSVEYWIMGDLMTPQELRIGSFARRVCDADVIFVPFFATLSAEMQLSMAKGLFRKKVGNNEDCQRQGEVMDFLKNTEAWKRSGGRDHVFVLTGYVTEAFFGRPSSNVAC